MKERLEQLVRDEDLVHHALLLKSKDTSSLKKALEDVFAKQLQLEVGHPDLLFFEDARLKIDTVRSITN